MRSNVYFFFDKYKRNACTFRKLKFHLIHSVDPGRKSLRVLLKLSKLAHVQPLLHPCIAVCPTPANLVDNARTRVYEHFREILILFPCELASPALFTRVAIFVECKLIFAARGLSRYFPLVRSKLAVFEFTATTNARGRFRSSISSLGVDHFFPKFPTANERRLSLDTLVGCELATCRATPHVLLVEIHNRSYIRYVDKITSA